MQWGVQLEDLERADLPSLAYTIGETEQTMNRPEPPPPLTREQRRHLLDALEQISFFDTAQGRDSLLADLPPRLRRALARSTIASVDLAEIVDKAAQWGSLEDGTSAL